VQCDREDQAVRAEAIKSLANTDPSSLAPIAKRVLAKKDACSAPLRRTVVYLLGQPGDNDTPAAFWDFVTSAKVAIRDTPADRFDIAAWHSPDPDRSGTTYSRRAGYVGDPYGFDPEFFRISQAEALEMDPQQRWMLQLCWSALEHAGIVPSSLRGRRVGLFLTAGDVDYARRTVASGDPHRITAWGKLGANRAVGVGRVAFTLGLQGPAIFLDSTCSASLVAVHLAAQSLRCGDCDLAIAGGTNLILGPEETIGFARYFRDPVVATIGGVGMLPLAAAAIVRRVTR